MDDKIIATFCLCDDLLKAIHHPEDRQCQMNDAEIMTTACIASLLGCCVLADASRSLSCEDRLLLGKHIGKDIFRSLPELEALVGIQDQRLDKGLRLLATCFPDGFDGQAPFGR